MNDEEQRERGVVGHYVRGLGSSTRQNSLAYGYSLALTGAFGMLQVVARSPRVADIFLFGVGAAATFTIANALVTRGYRVRTPDEPAAVLALGTSFGFAAIAGALAATWLVAAVLSGWLAWLIGPFVASTVYLALTSAELLLARAIRDVAGIEEMDDP